MSGTILSLEGIHAGYGELRVLAGVDMRVRKGDVVSIIGPNGAGKSTTLKVILGLLRPTAGRVRFRDDDMTGLRPHVVIRRGIGYVPQGRIVFPAMTVRENLEMGGFPIARQRALVRERIDYVCHLFPRLGERLAQRAATMSGGEQQMLAIGRALMLRPAVLLMDEPSLGLSPLNVRLVFSKIRELKAEGFTIIMVEQNAAKALAISDHGYVLDLGRNRFDGAGQVLLADPRVRKLYLGAG